VTNAVRRRTGSGGHEPGATHMVQTVLSRELSRYDRPDGEKKRSRQDALRRMTTGHLLRSVPRGPFSGSTAVRLTVRSIARLARFVKRLCAITM
jgi:hypothetical protein